MSFAPTNPADRKAILDAIREVSDSMTRSEAERDLVKDIVKTVSEKYNIDKKVFKKMAKTFHKDNFDQEVGESEDFATMYESVVKS